MKKKGENLHRVKEKKKQDRQKFLRGFGEDGWGGLGEVRRREQLKCETPALSKGGGGEGGGRRADCPKNRGGRRHRGFFLDPQ